MNLANVYCQSCRAANLLSETHCQNCGNRLLLVVYPNSLQYEQNSALTYYEDHLLERVTTLERQLGLTVEKLEAAYELIGRCLAIIEKDHLIVEAYQETIREMNPALAEVLKRRSTEKTGADRKSEENKQHKTGKKTENVGRTIFEAIKAQHPHPNAELFSKLVDEGITLLARGDEKEAFQMLERAALLSAQNSALFFLIGENLFRADQTAKAAKYLEKAAEFSPADENITLLRAAIAADDGDIETARRFLKSFRNLTELKKLQTAADFLCGMLAGCEENWPAAAKFFERANERANAPELDFLAGCAHFQAKNETTALVFFEKAIASDVVYADALFMQSVVFERLRQSENARNARRAAMTARENGAQSLAYLKKGEASVMEKALPFEHFGRKNAKIISGGAPRIYRFFKKIILDAAA